MAKSRSVGTKLTIDSKVVGALSSITGVEASSDTTEVTDMGNTTGYREYLGGFKDGGEVSAEGYLDGEDEGQDAMYAAFEDQEVHKFAINFPAAIGKSWTFDGVVTKFSTSASTDDAIKFSGAIKVSGKPALAATASEANAQSDGGEQQAEG